jgi:hypothetical protein
MAAGPQGQRRSDVMAGGPPAPSSHPHHAGLEALLLFAAKDAAQGGFEAFLFGGRRGGGGRSLLSGQLGDMQRILNNKKEVYKGTVSQDGLMCRSRPKKEPRLVFDFFYYLFR